MTKLAIQVLLYPHDSRVGTDFQRFSWHKPAGIRVCLTNGKNQDFTLVTGSDGTARKTVPADSYELSLPNLKGFVFQDRRIAVTGGQQAATLLVYPDHGHWLVPLRLVVGPLGQPLPAAIANGDVRLEGPGGSRQETFTSLADGSVYAVWPKGDVRVEPQTVLNVTPVQSGFLLPTGQEQERIDVEYRLSPASITIRPRLRPSDGSHPIPGVTFELSQAGQGAPLRQVTRGAQACVFSDLQPGFYTVRVVPPAEYNGSPIRLIGGQDEVTVNLTAGPTRDLSPSFRFKYATGGLRGRVVDSTGQALSGVALVASSNELVVRFSSGPKGRYSRGKLRAGTWTVMLDQAVTQVGGRTLTADPARSSVVVRVKAGRKVNAPDLTLELEGHGIFGQVRDEAGKPVPYAIVEIRDQRMNVIGTVVADDQGDYAWESPNPGTFAVNLLTRDGRTVQRQLVTVNSRTRADLISRDDIGHPVTRGPGTPLQLPTTPRIERESLTDLSAYPVLTEEISTAGPPAPVTGAPGAGGGGRDYGQVVGQVVRDVLGWRPSTDVSGFQAALAGAFELREVEGHTEWTWQQRGYAVQADMGALTGAQASIYARAKNALDQVLPLLAGLTPLNPALFPPQDLEAIRTVISTELQELVSELALPGGPRIQRVDELFTLLLGEGVKSENLNPDVVQGQLGKLRDRFGLTVDQIRTVDEEHVVTNFRTIIEHVLALHASWTTDRGLLSPFDARASLGTVLIWLSRSLEAVSESVDDLEFALDSVFVDAAQRQVISLNLHGEKALLLSDLLDWIRRASRDEGPRIIQDAGKDGVFAFAPVLRRLRGLTQQTRRVARYDSSLPHGLKTPRVDRALGVLVDQLEAAARLASHVRSDAAPQISEVEVDDSCGTLTLDLTGANFRTGAKAILIPVDRDELPDVHSRGVTVTPPGFAQAVFNDPRTKPDGAKASWQVMLVNPDGAQSNQMDALAPQ